MIRLLLVDDHPLVRHGLRQVLEDEADIEVAGEAGTTEQALAALRAGAFDVVVLDLGLPGRSGIEALPELLRHESAPRVLVLSVHPEGPMALRAIEAGAAGYLSKAASPDELVRAIRKVARGGRHVGAVLAEEMARHLQGGSAGSPRLSTRETTVLRLLASGLPLKEIARQLGLSPKTVSTYRGRVLDKLGLGTNADLTLYAASAGLIDPPP